MPVKNKDRGSPRERARGEVVRAAGLVSAGTMVSRVLGLLRDVAIAGAFGAGFASDAFFVALRVPNLIRRLLGEGPLSSAFIPVFSEYRERRGPGEEWRLAANLTGLLGGFSLLVAMAGVAAAPLVVRVLAPEWDLLSPKGALTVRLTRITFPYLFLVILYAVFMAVLNSCRRFFVPAVATSLLNLGMILGALVMSRWFDPPILGLAWGVILGGGLQLAVNLPSLRQAGFRWRPGFDWRDAGVRRVGVLMLPTIVGLAVNDVNQVVDTVLASLLAEGSVSWLFYASRLTQLPLGLVGIAVGTAILPTLSSLSARGETEDFKATVAFGLRVIFFLTLPAVVGLVVLREPIASLLFQRGEFTAADTMATARAILHYSLGMWAAAGLRVVASAFYSVRDTRTPFLTAVAAMAINVALDLWLMTFMSHAGLALATSLSLAFQFFLLLFLLRRRLGPLGLAGTAREVAKIGAASALMGLICAFSLGLLPAAGGEGLAFRLIVVVGEVVLGGAVYLAASGLLRCEEFSFVVGLARNRIKGWG